MKLGQPAEITTDPYPARSTRAASSFIAQEAEFTPKTVQTQKERVKLVYRIKIDIDESADGVEDRACRPTPRSSTADSG